MIDIKDFPEGTKINILYTTPITEYYGKKLPYTHASTNTFFIDKNSNAMNIPIGSINIYFPINDIDFSEIEYFGYKSTTTDFPKTDNTISIDFPKIKKLYFQSFESKELQSVTLNCGDDFEQINGFIFPNTTSQNCIGRLKSNSKKIKNINNLEIKTFKEIYIECDCQNLTSTPYKNNYSNLTTITYHSGFPNCKYSETGYYYNKMPNLTYESCISILNNLYNFTEKSETPTSSQGKLKVTQSFLDLVGDEISIGTNKGWQITVG